MIRKAISWVLQNEWKGQTELAYTLSPGFRSPGGRFSVVLESKFSWSGLALWSVGQTSAFQAILRACVIQLALTGQTKLCGLVIRSLPAPVTELGSWPEGQVSSRTCPGKHGALGVPFYSFHFITDFPSFWLGKVKVIWCFQVDWGKVGPFLKVEMSTVSYFIWLAS